MYYTPDRITNELNHYRAQIIAKEMLNNGLISLSEFNKLADINLQTFCPMFAEIMPKRLDISGF